MGRWHILLKEWIGYSRKQLLKCLQWKISVSWTIVLHRTNIKVHTSDVQKIIEKYSSRVGLDMAEFYMRIVFSFVTGNSDMHLKNFSLIETEVGSGDYVLSPAYDLLPVNVIMPEDTEQLAIPMNGKKRNVRRKDFLIFADVCGLSRISAEKMISLVVKNKDKMKKMCDESYIPEKMKSDFNHLIEERMLILAD